MGGGYIISPWMSSLGIPPGAVTVTLLNYGSSHYCTVIVEIIPFLLQKHLKTVTVTATRKLIQMTFKVVSGNQCK